MLDFKEHQVKEPTRAEQKAIYRAFTAYNRSETADNLTTMLETTRGVCGLDFGKLDLSVPEEDSLLIELTVFYVEGLSAEKKSA